MTRQSNRPDGHGGGARFHTPFFSLHLSSRDPAPLDGPPRFELEAPRPWRAFTLPFDTPALGPRCCLAFLCWNFLMALVTFAILHPDTPNRPSARCDESAAARSGRPLLSCREPGVAGLLQGKRGRARGGRGRRGSERKEEGEGMEGPFQGAAPTDRCLSGWRLSRGKGKGKEGD